MGCSLPKSEWEGGETSSGGRMWDDKEEDGEEEVKVEKKKQKEKKEGREMVHIATLINTILCFFVLETIALSLSSVISHEFAPLIFFLSLGFTRRKTQLVFHSLASLVRLSFSTLD